MGYDLTNEDKSRIKNADFYDHAKTIMKSFEDYLHVNVGEVYSIYFDSSSGGRQYVTRYSSRAKSKFLVVHKDNGFIFAKHINSGGGLSKDVICLTIRYPSRTYKLELDDAQAEAIIFSKEEEFDPFKEGKALAKKKNKARNINKKNLIKFTKENLAYNFIQTMKVGDKIYDAHTAFGEGTIEWTVVSISKTKSDKTPVRDWNNQVYAHGVTESDRHHNACGFEDKVELSIECKHDLPSERRWTTPKRTVIFRDFTNNGRRNYYSVRPSTIDDV